MKNLKKYVIYGGILLIVIIAVSTLSKSCKSADYWRGRAVESEKAVLDQAERAARAEKAARDLEESGRKALKEAFDKIKAGDSKIISIGSKLQAGLKEAEDAKQSKKSAEERLTICESNLVLALEQNHEYLNEIITLKGPPGSEVPLPESVVGRLSAEIEGYKAGMEEWKAAYIKQCSLTANLEKENATLRRSISADKFWKKVGWGLATAEAVYIGVKEFKK